ncbi:2817_t:CDS:2, partial [Cetraspora pellucida]
FITFLALNTIYLLANEDFVKFFQVGEHSVILLADGSRIEARPEKKKGNHTAEYLIKELEDVLKTILNEIGRKNETNVLKDKRITKVFKTVNKANKKQAVIEIQTANGSKQLSLKEYEATIIIIILITKKSNSYDLNSAHLGDSVVYCINENNINEQITAEHDTNNDDEMHKLLNIGEEEILVCEDH